MKMHPLPLAFYTRDTETVARELLGKYIVRQLDQENTGAYLLPVTLIARIVETEAYTQDDPASHSFKGPNPGNEVMFRQGGCAYVYRIYGLYNCFNVVTEEEGTGNAVLIRAGEPVAGTEWMWERRFPDEPFTLSKLPRLLSGPGRLCAGLGITRERHNGISLLAGELTLCENPLDPPPAVSTSTRIGITRARERLWRFTISDSPFVSRPPAVKAKRIKRGDRG